MHEGFLAAVSRAHIPLVLAGPGPGLAGSGLLARSTHLPDNFAYLVISLIPG